MFSSTRFRIKYNRECRSAASIPMAYRTHPNIRMGKMTRLDEIKRNVIHPPYNSRSIYVWVPTTKKRWKSNGKTPQIIAESFCCLQMMMLKNAEGNYPYYVGIHLQYTVYVESRVYKFNANGTNAAYKKQTPAISCSVRIYKTNDLSIKKCIFCLKFNKKKVKLKHLVLPRG